MFELLYESGERFMRYRGGSHVANVTNVKKNNDKARSLGALCSMNPPKKKIKNKNGTVIRPPPIPNNPAKKPTGNAVSTIRITKYKYSFKNIELIFM